MTNIFAVLFQVAAALFILRAALRGAPARRADGCWPGLFLGPRPLHALDEPLGARASWACVLLVAAAPAALPARASWPSPLLAFAVIPLRHLRPQLPARGCAAGRTPLRASCWPHAEGDLELPRRPAAPRIPTSASGTRGRGCTGPTWYYFNQNADEAIVRGIVAIGNPALWWVSVPVSPLGPRHRARGARPAAALLRASASSACTCPGASRRARSTTATTSSRRSPTRASASACSSTGTGTPPDGASWPARYVALVVVHVPLLPALPRRACPSRTPGTTSTSRRRAALDLVPDLGLRRARAC